VHDRFRAVVVDRPEQAELPMGARKAAGFPDVRVFEAPADLKSQGCRLLRVGTAGNGQQ
tara:strand:+ start:506 stop:682 length:177 start_codon:yes stop_codon:yes gene_type:complete